MGAGIALTGVLGGAVVAGPSYAEPRSASPLATTVPASSASPQAAANPSVSPAPPVPDGAPVQTRGDVVGRRGVPVINATVSASGRSVSALVYWNQAMIARPGNRDRFNIRLVSFGAAGASAASVLFSNSTSKRPPAIQRLKITLSKASAKILRRSSDVVLAVSQQYGLKGRHQNKYFRQYATVTHLKGQTAVRSAGPAAVLAGPASRVGRDCRTIEIRPGADLSGCDLPRANLSVCDLAGLI